MGYWDMAYFQWMTSMIFEVAFLRFGVHSHCIQFFALLLVLHYYFNFRDRTVFWCLGTSLSSLQIRGKAMHFFPPEGYIMKPPQTQKQ